MSGGGSGGRMGDGGSGGEKRDGGKGDGSNGGESDKRGNGGAKADTSAWLAVAAGTIGAFMATIDTSIVNAALPTIQGEVGASGTEGTWISTAYLVAEIVMIPMAGWLEKTLGLRTFLLIATSFFTGFSVFCGLSTSLAAMIIGRVGQGFSGGALIPTALSIVAKRLPPSQQPLGTGLFGVTAVFGPVAGPLLGGWLTENVSWHYAFFLNLPVGIGLLSLLLVGLESDKPKLAEFAKADVLGILGLVLGLGGLTTLLEEGQRERWFESTLIRELAGVSLVGFGLLIAGQFVASKPVIRLRIILEREFFGVFVMTMVVGAALYGILYLIPQFLTAVPGYNSQQSGLIAAISGMPTMAMMVTYPFLVRRLDIRIAVAFGLLLYSISCFLESNLTADSAGGQFIAGQVLRGLAMFFSMLFLNQAATSSVAKQYAEDASGLFNAARNLGGSFGLAAISTLQDRRTDLHFARLAESLPGNLPLVQEAARGLGVGPLSRALMAQATVLAYGDLYWLYGVVLIATIPLVMLLKPLKQTGAGPAAK